MVPADRKWFTRLVVSAAIIDAIQSLDPRFPEVDPKVRAEFKKLKAAARGRSKRQGRARRRRSRRSEAVLVAGRGRALRPVSRPRNGAGRSPTIAGCSRRSASKAFNPGLSWITILRKRDNFRKAFKDFDPAVGRALRRARRAAPAEGRRHRPASRQDRIDDQQREARARADRRAGLAGRVLLVVGAGGVEPAEEDLARRAQEDEHHASSRSRCRRI